MAKIKFSHRYGKILNSTDNVVKYATLLGVFKINLEDQAGIFFNYDTNYGEFLLPPQGEYLMLLFLKPKELCHHDENLFTILRRSTPKKEAYYRLHIGEDFEVILDL